MKRKSYFVVALALAAVICGGTYAYAFTQTPITPGIASATGNIATVEEAVSQPDWDSVLSAGGGAETFRPNAAGTSSQTDPIGDSPEYACVDEVTADEDSTYVDTSGGATELDTYNIPDHSEGIGTITSVTVYIRTRCTTSGHAAEVVIRTYNTNYSDNYTSPLPTSYTNISAVWTTNPNTGNAWTWDEIDALQIGVRQYDLGTGVVQTTQVWAEVDYEYLPLTGEVPTGDLFEVTPNPYYNGDLDVKVYLANTENLSKAYQYLNMKLYLEDSVEAGQTPNYKLLTLDNGNATFTMEGLTSVSDTWTQTSQEDFQGGTLYQVDTTTSPGDVLIEAFSDNVTDTFDDETKIATSDNLTVSGGQVKLVAGGASGDETFRPNAAGDDTNIASQYPGSGAHWDKVDDVTADDYTTYVYTNSTTYQRDLYNTPDHSTGLGAIDSVTAYFRFANSATTKWGIVYQGPDDDGFLRTTEISTTAQITDSIIDTLEWDTTNGMQPDIINISGDIYAIVYNGAGNDGWLATIEVNSSGNITDSIIDTFEFDGTNCVQPEIIHISGDVYAIAYTGPGTNGWLCTVEIDSAGDITNAIIDSLEFDPDNCVSPEIIHISGNIYAIAYTGPGADGWLVTVEIDTAGNITNAVVDSLEFDADSGQEVDIIHISGDIYAIAYNGPDTDGWLCTVDIDSSGNITDTLVDTFEYDTTRGGEADIVHVSGDVYAIAYRGPGSDGWLATVDIDSSGDIAAAVIDSYEWNTTDGWEPNMAHVAGNFYAIAYRTGATTLGNLITVEIAIDGQITDSIFDTLQFEATYGFRPKLILVSGTPGSVYARAAIKTNGSVYTGDEESTATDTFVTESYQWTTNPSTTSAWTWDEIDALQIGVELRTDSTVDGAVCTQVYVVVDYTAYYPTGVLVSINLLSGETVASIDDFDYDASAVPSGTGLQVQFSQNGTSWYNSAGTLGGWDILSEGTDTIDLSGLAWSGANFYYKMEFTSDGSDTPVLDEITVNFSLYYTSGTLTSSAYDTGDDLDWDWSTISFTIDEPSTTDIVFQIRTAATEGGLSSATWYGPTGAGDNYTSSGTAVNSVHDGDRWIQYKAYFSGPGTSTPKLSDVSISYTVFEIPRTLSVIGGAYCLASDDTSEWGTGWTITPELYCEVTQR